MRCLHWPQVTELDLVCEQQWWPSTSTALFYVGSLIGNILFGQIADRWGRLLCCGFTLLSCADTAAGLLSS